MIRDLPILFQGEMVRAIRADLKTNTRRVIQPLPLGHHWQRLNGYKCVSRIMETSQGWFLRLSHQLGTHEDGLQWIRCPYGGPGDRLWVKENFLFGVEFDDFSPKEIPDHARPVYCADEPVFEYWHGKTRPSIFMPRWVSRIDLEITGLKVERLQEISEEDAIAEGIERTKSNYSLFRNYGEVPHLTGGVSPIKSFSSLWDSINSKPSPVMVGKHISSYVSFPWEAVEEVREHRGKPWIVCGNPYVWAVAFKKIDKIEVQA